MTTRLAIAIAGAVFAFGPATAEPIALDFTGKVNIGSAPYMTGQADGVFHIMSSWEPVEAAGLPVDGMSGDCFGSAALVGGKMSGEGHCAYKDAAGDTVFVRWWMANAASPMGAWQWAGGTGRWATAVGGGTYEDIPTDNPAVSMSHIVGTVEFK